jgi:hypothetical protein
MSKLSQKELVEVVMNDPAVRAAMRDALTAQVSGKYAQRKTRDKKPPKNAKLAKQISDLLNNPDCPVDLYNAIGDVIAGMPTGFDVDSPEYIEAALNAYDELGCPDLDITSGDGISVIVPAETALSRS